MNFMNRKHWLFYYIFYFFLNNRNVFYFIVFFVCVSLQNEIFEQLKITDDEITNVGAAVVELSADEKCVLKTTLAASNSFKSNNNLEKSSPLNGESFFQRNNNKNLLRNDGNDAADDGCGNLYEAVNGVDAKMYDNITDDVDSAINRNTVKNFSDSMMEMRDDWNFMTQFDKFVEFEMKNFTSLCNQSNIENNLTSSSSSNVNAAVAVLPRTTTATRNNDKNNNNILRKPVKHVSCNF